MNVNFSGLFVEFKIHMKTIFVTHFAFMTTGKIKKTSKSLRMELFYTAIFCF